MKNFLICFCLIFAVLFSACGAKESLPPSQEQPYSQEEPLMAAADSREEAEELAELYGIELVSYSYGIATFYTDEDPHAVIQRGEENGWKLLEINGAQQIS